LSNPASFDVFLTSPTVLSTGSNPVKLCINCGRRLPHTLFKHFFDTSSQAVLMLLMLFKMLDEGH
jgi:hypothetical protein